MQSNATQIKHKMIEKYKCLSRYIGVNRVFCVVLCT